ncbi:Leucyl aminopeptidase (aminopeptidase T) [Desulfatibacillum alkenivorans DSM 16219]|jgi:aminopeptidase|uniref:Leucyl aminopeptidase (Aminopeptidase T) n=1 Tax=Desulfatibacillum alkenivorans DSM 16219 TaxID=1121393 RepID=A0A1M6GQ80_9BACT|nr:aminopeptidase [Desulfatibacillum alkenivorans]SHJ12103.1 Leucyl aminopeptidase (aminopeptidase T) [Desulfatibacillum alkenivorans DSM 16219]
MDIELLKKYAQVFWWGLTTARVDKYKKGDSILVRYDRAAMETAEVLQAMLLQQGMNPILRMSYTPTMERQFYELSNNKQLVFIPPGDEELFQNINGSISLIAPESLTHLAHIDSSKMGKAAVARKPFRDILDKREQEGAFGWTLGIVPTQELARQAKLSLKAYTEQWIKACLLDLEDPAKEWRKLFNRATSLKAWLNGMDVDYYQVKSTNTDLKVDPGEKRRWIGISGHNIPSFELFLSPDWRGTEGVYFANQPSFRSGNYVKDVRLEFSKGKVVKVTAKQGEDFVKKQVAMDKGAGRLGEFSLTDRTFSKIDKFMANTLFDENYGGKFGNCHVAIGASYADTYSGDAKELDADLKKKLGFNDSALHWDLVNTEKKTVTAHLKSGESLVIYKDGEFTGATAK